MNKRRIFLTLTFAALIAAMLGGALAQQQPQGLPSRPFSAGKPTELSMRRGASRQIDLRALPQIPPVKRERPEREEPEIERTEIKRGNNIQTEAVAPAIAPQSAPAPSPSASFDGLDSANWGAGHPPDPNGDVGPTYYIQTINTSIGVFRKSDGVRVAAFTFDTLMGQAFNDIRGTNNFGDPVVLYDTFEDRWVITDFAFQLDASFNVINPPGSYQVIAVSKTGDPVSGGWNFYSINTAGGLGDYPKFGIWPDGLYMSANMFGYPAGSSFKNPRVYCFNKAQMYAGNPSVQVVTFDAPSADFAIMPSNARLQAGTPPPGTPNYYVSTWEFLNALTVYKFHVDWNHISLSTFTGPDTPLAATSWPNASVANAPSQGGNPLDVLQIRAMVQNQYSNIGGVESLWTTHTVRRGNTTGFAAPRWYQVNVTGGTVNANLPQAATWDPDGANVIYRFMPSLAVDRAGDMALGYSTSSSTTKPAIKYAGRLSTDPVNTFSQTETVLTQGTGTQTGMCGGSTCIRWGDYSSMTLDPNGCTFWYTNEYYSADGLSFLTRIGAFAFSSCTPVGAGGTISGTVTTAVGGAPISGATVALGSRMTTTDLSGNYAFNGMPAGTYPVITASNPGFTSVSFTSIVVTDGGTTPRDFSLGMAPGSGCLTDTTQLDFQAGVGTAVDLVTSPGDVTLLGGPKIDQQNTTLGTSGVGVTVTTWGGQTFTPAVTGKAARVDLNMFCSGCTGTTPNLTLSIRATSGGLPTGADIASATITGFNSGAAVFYTANFGSPPTLTAGTQYALAIRPTANPSPGTYALTRSGTATAGSDVYPGGTRVSGATSGTVWSIPLTGGVSTDAGFKVYMDSGFAPSGNLISSTKDSDPAAGLTPTWSTLSWTATVPANTTLQFQVAASNSAIGPFSFVGPDGTAGTFFTTSGASLSQFTGNRYLQYKAYLTTTDSTMSPTLNDVTVCFSNADCSGATATITPTPAQVCPLSTGNTASGPAGSNYLWSITNGTITGGGTAQTVTYTAGSSGNVGLMLSMTVGGCPVSTSANIPIVSVATPTINAGGPTTFCSGDSVTLTSSSASGNQWKLNGNPIAGATNQTYTATASGDYTVTVTDSVCTSVSATSVATTVTVNPVPPTPTISATTNGTGTQDQACPEVPLTLTANGSTGATSYQWYQDNAPINGATSQTYQAISAATYSVTATIGSCTSPRSAGYVVQNPTPHSPFISFRGQNSSVTTLAICQGSSQIIDSDSATGIQWYKDGVAIPGAMSMSYTATQAGVYTAQLNALGCHSQFGRNVTLTVDAMPPTPTVSGDTNGTGTQDQACPEQPLTLHANGATGAQSYQWYSDNAPVGNGTSTLVVTAVGNYSVTATNGACTTPRSATYVVQNPTPHSPFISFRNLPSSQTTAGICAGSSIIIDSDSATGIQWYKDGVAIPGAGSQSYTATQAGVYTAQLNALGCHSQFGRNVTLTVNPLPATPAINAGGSTTICAGSSVTLTSSSATGNQWYLNNSPINGATGNTYGATASGSYTVKVTSGGCTSLASVATVVTVATPPTTATVGGNTSIPVNGTTAALGGDTATSGTGTWTVQSGGTGTFSDLHAGSSTFTHTGGAGPIVLRWTISTGPPCPDSFAELTVVIAKPPTITKAFAGGFLSTTQASALTFTLTNPNATVALTGVAFTDTFPAGLVVASPANANTGCGGTFMPNPGDTSLSFSGGTIPAGGSCVISVSVQATTPGSKTNTTSAITSINGGTGTTSNTVTVTTYDKCLKDDTTLNFVQFSSTTGDYRFVQCSGGSSTLTGTGTLTINGNVIALTDNKPDRRLSISYFTNTTTGTAAITITYAPGVSLSFLIRDTHPNAVCACGQ